MGKYMKKSKTTGEIAVMDVSFGVCTRAKTQALRRRQARLSASSRPAPARPRPRASAPSPSPARAPAQPSNSGGYLQLRSRRLEKPPIVINDSKRQRNGHSNKEPQNPNRNVKVGSRVRVGPANSGSAESGLKKEGENEDEEIEDDNNNNNDGDSKNTNNESKDLGIEASFGENFMDIEGRERSTRESTPCSLIRDPESIRTPSSTTRSTGSNVANRRIQNSVHGHIPTAHEMDEFFAGAEKEQQRQFIEKYNFDPVTDKPLPGRFEWEKLDP